MAEMDPGLVTGVNPYPVTRPELIPVQRYFDPDFYQAEVDHLWPHVWQMACRLETDPQCRRLDRIFQCRQVGDRRAHQGRHQGPPQPLPPPRRADRRGQGQRARQLRQGGLRLSVPRLALEHRRRMHLRLWQAPVQRRSRRKAGTGPGPLPGRNLGRLRLHQPRRRRTQLARLPGAGAAAARGARGRRSARRMVVRHGAAGQLEDRDGSLPGRLPRDEDPSAAARGDGGDVQQPVRAGP